MDYRKDLSKIAQHLVEIPVHKGETIIREMEEGNSLYLIHKGNATVYRNNIPVGTLTSGECFGEMGMLIQSKRTATIVAEDEMQLFRLDSVAFYEMIFDQTAIALEMMKLLSRRLRSALARVVSGEDEPAGVNTSGTASNNPAIAQVNNGVILQRMLVLQKISLFAHFAQEDFIRLAHMVEEVSYEAGEIICKSGEAGDAMYGIIEGNIKVHRDRKSVV